MKEWEAWEDDYLEENYPILSIPVKVMAGRLKRSEQAIYLRAQIKGLKRSSGSRIKDDPDLDWKIYHYRKLNLSVSEIADKLGFRKGQIQHRLYSRGLHYHQPAGPVPEWIKPI